MLHAYVCLELGLSVELGCRRVVSCYNTTTFWVLDTNDSSLISTHVTRKTLFIRTVTTVAQNRVAATSTGQSAVTQFIEATTMVALIDAVQECAITHGAQSAHTLVACGANRR